MVRILSEEQTLDILGDLEGVPLPTIAPRTMRSAPAIGFTGIDFETAVRERIPIMSVLFNNFSMAIELNVMPISTEKYRSTDISEHYADMAKAFGGMASA